MGIGDQQHPVGKASLLMGKACAHRCDGKTKSADGTGLLQTLTAQLQHQSRSQPFGLQRLETSLKIKGFPFRSRTGILGIGVPAGQGRQTRAMVRFALDPGNRLSQGKKLLLRLSMAAHDVISVFVLYMFLWIPELAKRVNRIQIRIYSSSGFALEMIGQNAYMSAQVRSTHGPY